VSERDAYDHYDQDEPDDEPDEYEDFDCHMHGDGQCGAAGSEECDFECPYMRDIRLEQHRQREARKAKRKQKSPQKRPPLGKATDV
jgi:hypothetical protein